MTATQAVEKVSRLSLWLFGKPAWEIEDLEGEVDFRVLEKVQVLGKELQGRLHWVSIIGKELLRRGWDAYGTLYDIDFYKHVSIEDAKKDLKELGLDAEVVGLEEEDLDE